MNWEVIASLGEWAGAVAVIFSLLYLARQIKHANEQSQAAARFSFLDAYGRANAAIAMKKENAAAFLRGLDGKEQDEGEEMQFVLQLGQFLNTWTVMYDLHQEGYLPENQWFLVRSDIQSAFITPGGRKFWEELGRVNAHEGFVAYVDGLLETNDAVYEFRLGQPDNQPTADSDPRTPAPD